MATIIGGERTMHSRIVPHLTVIVHVYCPTTSPNADPTAATRLEYTPPRCSVVQPRLTFRTLWALVSNLSSSAPLYHILAQTLQCLPKTAVFSRLMFLLCSGARNVVRHARLLERYTLRVFHSTRLLARRRIFSTAKGPVTAFFATITDPCRRRFGSHRGACTGPGSRLCHGDFHSSVHAVRHELWPFPRA
ncbi:hypothetical protein PLICRDRAFT_610780 [Plicaturopsis crispa FD-325 SS-3]|nr:hypothetical protein PLICRDRAFT_610780 [Plicaturopsis crispa FD-325 SS-3]